jgi:hypothetical protein
MKRGLFCIFFLTACLLSSFAQQDTSYRSYLGKYQFPLGAVVPFVEVSGDSLTALTMSSEAGNSPLEHTGGDNFNITNFNGTANFRRNDTTKQVIGIHIEAMGHILDGEKDKITAKWSWSIVTTKDQICSYLKYNW